MYDCKKCGKRTKDYERHRLHTLEHARNTWKRMKGKKYAEAAAMVHEATDRVIENVKKNAVKPMTDVFNQPANQTTSVQYETDIAAWKPKHKAARPPSRCGHQTLLRLHREPGHAQVWLCTGCRQLFRMERQEGSA